NPLGYRRCRNASSSTTAEAVQVFPVDLAGRREACPATPNSNNRPTEAGAELLLLAGDRLGRTLAGAGIGMGPLAPNRQAAAMAQATIIAQVHEALDVHRHVAAQIAFHNIVAVDGLADLDDFGVGQLVHAAL